VRGAAAGAMKSAVTLVARRRAPSVRSLCCPRPGEGLCPKRGIRFVAPVRVKSGPACQLRM